MHLHSMTASPARAWARGGGAGDFRSAVGGGEGLLGCARIMSRHPHPVPTPARA